MSCRSPVKPPRTVIMGMAGKPDTNWIHPDAMVNCPPLQHATRTGLQPAAAGALAILQPKNECLPM